MRGTSDRARGVAAESIDTVFVPGALEIPAALQAMAVTRRYDALIALGAVIRGEHIISRLWPTRAAGV